MEKQLGITAKRQIEDEVGIAEFTRLCKESVRNYVGEWKTLTERIGYWIDIDDAYWTFAPEYVESVWANLKSLWDQGLLYEDIKVVPYCPRCGTALSSHELGQPDVYREVEDESAYVRFPLTDDGDAAAGLRPRSGGTPLDGLSLVAWTTTPWTLLSNTGAAVGPDLVYAVVGGDVVAESLVEQVFGEGATADATVPGTALVGLHYRRPFDDLAPGPADAGRVGWRVVAGDFVEADEGTGIVHLAPAFGEVDRQAGRPADLPTLNPVGPDGRFTDAVPWLDGRGRSATSTGRSTTGWRPPACCSAAIRTSTPIRTAGGAARHSSTGASRAGTSARRSARPTLVEPEPDDRVAPRAHPGRPDGGVAGQQRRLGPVPRPVLGHPAAGVAVRRGPRCTAWGRWPSCRS